MVNDILKYKPLFDVIMMSQLNYDIKNRRFRRHIAGI